MRMSFHSTQNETECKNQGILQPNQNLLNNRANQNTRKLADWEQKVKEVLQQNSQKSNIVFHNRKNFLLPSLEERKCNKQSRFSFNQIKCSQAANISFYNILASKMQQQICQKENMIPNGIQLYTSSSKFHTREQAPSQKGCRNPSSHNNTENSQI